MSRARRPRVCVIRQAPVTLDPRVRREVRALAGAGYEVDVICLRHGGEPRRARDGRLTYYRLPLPARRPRSAAGYVVHYGVFFLTAMLLSGLLHARRRYDVVQVHSLPDPLVFAAIIPRLFGAKVVLDLHEAMVEFFTTKFGVAADSRSARLVAAAEQASIRFADFAFTCTKEMRDAMISRGADPGRIGVVLNASEEDIFDVARHPPRGGGHGRYVVLCHGSVEERYGIDTGIRAVALLRDEIPNLHLRIVGSGSYLDEAERLARELGVEAHVSFSGDWVPMGELLEEIAGCDVGLVAMKVDAFRDLTHCNKMYDLVTMRRPVLMSRTRSVEAYFGEDCFAYFEGDDPQDLARAMRALHADRERAARLVERAAVTLEPYRWPIQRDHYVGLIAALMAPGNPPPQAGAQ
ncbi:MAG: glycosyltransferase [Solirubrobacteraceae bacterium]